jgi:prepilin-type N-terminal cleavage/methylation domain-containing protein
MIRNAYTRISKVASVQAAFTLVEMVVVIVIILLISVLILPSVLGSLNDRKFSDATRALQAVLMGARDRAIQSGNMVGVRLIRDDNDPFAVTQLVYVTVPEPYSVGIVSLTGGVVTPDVTPPNVDPHFEQVNLGKDGTPNTYDDIPRVVPMLSTIRFDHTGMLYTITGKTLGTPTTLSIAPIPTSVTAAPATHRYQIFGPPIPMAQAETTLLPEGMIIDLRSPFLQLSALPGPPDRELLRLPRSLNIPNQIPSWAGAPWGLNRIWGDAAPGGDDPPTPDPASSWPPMDILFAPNGTVVGDGARTPLIHFWLGERGDSGAIGGDNTGGTADDIWPNRPRKMVTLNTRTGLVVVTDDPQPAGTPSQYLEVYGRAEQSLGKSVLP